MDNSIFSLNCKTMAMIIIKFIYCTILGEKLVLGLYVIWSLLMIDTFYTDNKATV